MNNIRVEQKDSSIYIVAERSDGATVEVVRDNFFTGSHVYGTPRADSLIDWCVLIDWSVYFELQRKADKLLPMVCRNGAGSEALQFGKFLLICFMYPVDGWAFKAWREATQRLVARKPVNLAAAIQEMRFQEVMYRKAKKEQEDFEKKLIAAGNILK